MEIKIPEIGESVREALLAKWFKKTGDRVKRDEPLCEIETDKITLDLNADADGVLAIGVAEGETVAVGTVIGAIDQSEVRSEQKGFEPPSEEAKPHSAPATSPAVRQAMRELDLDTTQVQGSGKSGRITQEDVPVRVEQGPKQQPVTAPVTASILAASPAPVEAAAHVSVRNEEAISRQAAREERRPLSPIRKRIAERLVAARQQTAMLTTFNEADLSRISALRSAHREHFRQRHGAPLGLMPFFVKACVEALKEFPAVNASIDGDDLVYHHYYDLGIAIGGEKGLVVPVLRDADRLKLYEIDQSIAAFAGKIKANRLAIADLEGGTFTITNGGVYGSMLSTPILNPPQSAVLGMHAIQERPVVREGNIVIRPMMYLALSYDHRIIDGREAVSFLKRSRNT